MLAEEPKVTMSREAGRELRLPKAGAQRPRQVLEDQGRAEMAFLAKGPPWHSSGCRTLESGCTGWLELSSGRQ